MISNHSQFLDAIREKKFIRIVFYSQPDSSTVDRECAPLDYGPERGATGALNRYWIWDYENPAETNPLGLLPDQIVAMHVLGKEFEPEKLGVTGRPWFVRRDWGAHAEVANKPPSVAGAPK